MLQDCSRGAKSAVNLSLEFLCGDRLLSEINVRKSLILVLKYVATISTCNHLMVHRKPGALQSRKWASFLASFLREIVWSWS